MPEVETLRQEVRRREWEDAARRALTSRTNALSALNELLGLAGELGTGGNPMAEGLR